MRLPTRTCLAAVVLLLAAAVPWAASQEPASEQAAAFKAQYDAIAAFIEREEMAQLDTYERPTYHDTFSATFRNLHGIELGQPVWSRRRFLSWDGDGAQSKLPAREGYPGTTPTARALNELLRQSTREYPAWKADYKKLGIEKSLSVAKQKYEDDCAEAKQKSSAWHNSGKVSIGGMSIGGGGRDRKAIGKELSKLKSSYKAKCKKIKAKGATLKSAMDAVESKLKKLTAGEGKWRGKEHAAYAKAKSQCQQKARVRIAKVKEQPGITDLLRWSSQTDALERDIDIAGKLDKAGHDAKATQYRARIAKRRADMKLLSDKFVPLLTANPPAMDNGSPTPEPDEKVWIH
jgi:hypothetical protein